VRGDLHHARFVGDVNNRSQRQFGLSYVTHNQHAGVVVAAAVRDASAWLTVERLPTAHVWVEIGAERTEHLPQMVEVVIRPLDHVLIQCDAAVPRVGANVRTRGGRECAQPREVACALPSPFVKQSVDLNRWRRRLVCRLDCQSVLFCQAVQSRGVDVALDDEKVGQDLTRRPLSMAGRKSPLVARCMSSPVANRESALRVRSGQGKVRPGHGGSEAEYHLLSKCGSKDHCWVVRPLLRARASFIRNDSPEVTTTMAW
jgi:hypothetical protein